MCLSRITKRLKNPKTMQFYKVMYRLRRKGQPNLYFFQIRSQCDPIEKGQVKYASVGNIDIYASSDPDHNRWSYKAGFHGYTNLRQAGRQVWVWWRNRRWDFKKTALGNLYRVVVLCEGPVRTIGSQRGKRVVVADTMKILREIPLTRFATKKRNRL